MKKRIFSLLLVFVLAIASFAACGESAGNGGKTSNATDSSKSAAALEKAKQYVYQLYKDKQGTTASDFERVSVVNISGKKFTVTWSSNAGSDVKIVPGATLTTIDVNEQTTKDVEYVLTATIKDAEGNTLTQEFKHTIPKFKEYTYAEFAAAETGTTVVVSGLVTGLISKADGNSSNCVYFMDDNGGYYIYNLAQDPVTDLNLKIGQKIRATGTKDVYSGTFELVNASVEVLDSNVAAVTAKDYTDTFKNAKSLKDSSLTGVQSLFVTIKGVEVGGQGDNGYYYFKMGDLQSYVRISSSTCPIKKESNAFIEGHTSHTGWLADVTGILSLYDGAFYLTPATVDAFSYIGLPQKSDKEMAEYEAENLVIPAKITENTTLTVSETGKTYDAVKIDWVSDNACAVVENGKLVVTLPEEDATVTLTATLKAGSESVVKTFTIAVDAAPTDIYVAKEAGELKEGVAYKLAVAQNNIGKTIYATYEVSGDRYIVTTDKADKALNVYAEIVDGGYRFYALDGEAKKYIEVFKNASGKDAVGFLDMATLVWVYNADARTYTTNVGGTEFYLGCYNNYDTISASKTSYILGDNLSKVDVSQFPARVCTLAPAVYDAIPVAAPAEGTYKYGLYQKNLDQTLYFTGNLSGKYLETTDKVDKAVDVTVEVVDGGFRLYFTKDDAKSYIEIVDVDGKAQAALNAEPTMVWTHNTDANAYVANVAGTDYYLGTYNKYNTISASKTSYILGDNLPKIGDSQFPARLMTVGAVEVAPVVVETPVEGKAYKLMVSQNNLGEKIYANGSVTGDRYLETSNKLSKAVDVYAEAVDGGFRFYTLDGETKMYLSVFKNEAGKDAAGFKADGTQVWALNADTKTFTTTLDGTEYYLGCYNNYETISASKSSYILGDNLVKVDVSQFPSHLVDIQVVK